MTLSRRSFVQKSSAILGLGMVARPEKLLAASQAESTDASISFGLVADPHYAEIPDAEGGRCYHDSLAKFQQAVKTFNQRKLPFAVELGDFIDAGPSVKDDIKYLKRLCGVFDQFNGDRHFVLGNHCVTKLTKQQFLDNCTAKVKKTYYSFDHVVDKETTFHFIVLDGNFRADGVAYEPGNFNWTDTALPPAQIEWLKDDLAKAKGKVTAIFIHQNMDDDGDTRNMANSAAVRKVLEEAGNVVAVLQGHRHEGGYRKINGIHYCTLQAMVNGSGKESNSYAIATLTAKGELKIEPFGQQKKFE